MSITHIMRQSVWNTYIGEDKGASNCFCCENAKITQLSFECGHVIAKSKGGEIHIDNLRPICTTCNKSMGTENLEVFKKRFDGFKNTSDQTGELESLKENLEREMLELTGLEKRLVLEKEQVEKSEKEIEVKKDDVHEIQEQMNLIIQVEKERCMKEKIKQDGNKQCKCAMSIFSPHRRKKCLTKKLLK